MATIGDKEILSMMVDFDSGDKYDCSLIDIYGMGESICWKYLDITESEDQDTVLTKFTEIIKQAKTNRCVVTMEARRMPWKMLMETLEIDYKNKICTYKDLWMGSDSQYIIDND